jgi:hypothetical protein
MLAEALNNAFMTHLALDICTEREGKSDGTDLDSALLGKRLIVVGASHATKLACALEDARAIVVDLLVPGCQTERRQVSCTRAACLC